MRRKYNLVCRSKVRKKVKEKYDNITIASLSELSVPIKNKSVNINSSNPLGKLDVSSNKNNPVASADIYPDYPVFVEAYVNMSCQDIEKEMLIGE